MHWWRLLATLVTCVLLVVVTAVPAAARDRGQVDAVYLALGDSVAFGFSPLVDPRNAANFVGYPEALAERLDLNLTNASCPGEASGGFISLTGIDNVCRPYRASFPLHAAYSTAQLEFAVAFLRAHQHTRLVTLDIGANDLFVLEKQCLGAATCIQNGLPALLNMLAANLSTIYRGLRGQAHYKHELVALTYYVSNFKDPAAVAVIQAINATVVAATAAADGKTADGFGAFQAAAGPAGDSCTAGLLIKTPAGPTPCDVHPSPRGRDVLAGAIRATLHHAEEDGDLRDPD